MRRDRAWRSIRLSTVPGLHYKSALVDRRQMRFGIEAGISTSSWLAFSPQLHTNLEANDDMRNDYKSIAIGIPTYNRKYFVEANAVSLCNAELHKHYDIKILIIDDASHEYTTDYLASIYPAGSLIVQREKNSGSADLAICDLFKRCLALKTDAILLLDSDLIVNKDFIDKGLTLLKDTDGVVSLFNTLNHPIAEDNGALLVKRSVGSAGTLWDRALAEEIAATIESGRQWDWRCCSYINSTNRKIYCSRASLVQHIAYYEGENSSLESGDYGVGFVDSGFENIFITLESIVRAQIRLGSQLDTRRNADRFVNEIANLDQLMRRVAELEQKTKKLEKYSLRTRLKRLVLSLKRNALATQQTR